MGQIAQGLGAAFGELQSTLEKMQSDQSALSESTLDVPTYIDLSLKIIPRLIESIAPKLAAMLENQPQTDLSANPFEAVGMALGVIMEAMAEFNDEFAAAGTNFQDFPVFGKHP